MILVQVSQISQSWRPESGTGLRAYSSSYRTSSSGTLSLTADDVAVRHRRNPHQMNWWTRTYGYHASSPGGYRPNYSLPMRSVHPPRTAASFVPSQMSPSCNQVQHSSHELVRTFHLYCSLLLFDIVLTASVRECVFLHIKN